MMNVALSIQAILTATLVLLYFIFLGIINSIVTKFGEKQKFLKKRVVYTKKFFAFLLFSVLLMTFAFIWGIDIRAVLIFASSFFAVVGVALFASWSILSNMTSGIIIFFLFPYKIGHNITIVDGDSSITGKIYDMTLFHIKIKDEDGNSIYYPNNLITQKPIMKMKEART